MVGEWRKVRFGEVAEILPGKYIPASDYDAAGAYVVYGSNSIMGRVHIPLYEGPIIAFARIGSNCGATMYSAAPCWINNNAAGIRAKAGCDTRFIYYWMQSCDFSQIREGSGQPYISDHTLKELVLLLPPLPEQRAIAHILGTLDDKIELNRRMSETLEAMARALFKAWFVDFEPVRAKMEGRWERGQSLPGLPAHLYDLFPDRLVDSELGEIPEGWRVGNLGDVAENLRRGVQPDCIAPNTPYIALEHMPRRCIALFDWGTAEGIESNKFEFKKGEILFGKLRPYFHKVGVAPVDGVCSTDIVVVAPRRHLWTAFVLGHVSSVEFVDYTNAGSSGTKMPRTSWADMARYEIVLPPEPIAEAFNTLVQTLIERIISGISESRTLAALRDALLPKLIRGEIRVKDAERFVQDVGR
jgi:type I restriction enzyme S subunit